MSGLNIVGSIRSDGTGREVDDYYATDPKAINDLLEKEFFDGLIWENACGEGNLSKRLKEYGYGRKVLSTDLINRGYGDGLLDFLDENQVINFLKTQEETPKNIITNPPYKVGKEWVEASLNILPNDGKLALLMKLVFLESKSRFAMFKNTPLKKVLVYSSRLGVYKNNEIIKNSGLIAYAWFIWDKTYIGKPVIDWIG